MNRQLTMLIVDDMEVERISFAEIFKDEYQILRRKTGNRRWNNWNNKRYILFFLIFACR